MLKTGNATKPSPWGEGGPLAVDEVEMNTTNNSKLTGNAKALRKNNDITKEIENNNFKNEIDDDEETIKKHNLIKVFMR